MRSGAWPRGLWAIPVLCGAAVVAGVALTAAAPAPDTTYLVLDAVAGLTCPAVGVLILSRWRRHPVGRLFCLSGAGLALQALSGGYAAYAQPHGLPGALAAAWVTNWVFFTGFGPLLLLPMLLPDGRLPSPRWRPVLVAAVAGMTVLQVMLMLRDRIWVWGREVPSSFGFVPTRPVAELAFGVVALGLAASGMAALATRVT
ncbi:hypothetical protein [Microbispora triticiradicis]|uniref:DUF5134 domain-containing protein n=3 Tax=Microbispora TaxID=2005 RepID=A0ABY3LR51_9ACTN|nr:MULTISPECIES: hypothetical protein [Microbispora]TLP54620.1 hypothetical protein FED44_28175 [Microbispora fusca]TYB50801.1 hypothetical protein FXF59_27670 [Microbispora tritici]